MYFCFSSFFHSYGSFNRHIFNIIDLPWVSCTLLIHIFTLFIHRKSFCTFICQVAPRHHPDCSPRVHQCSLLPQTSLSFIRHPFIKLPWASLGLLLRNSSDWSRGFSSCYHSKMGKHIAKSSSLTSSLFLHLECLSFHSFLVLYIPILTLHTCNVALVDSLS